MTSRGHYIRILTRLSSLVGEKFNLFILNFDKEKYQTSCSSFNTVANTDHDHVNKSIVLTLSLEEDNLLNLVLNNKIDGNHPLILLCFGMTVAMFINIVTDDNSKAIDGYVLIYPTNPGRLLIPARSKYNVGTERITEDLYVSHVISINIG